MSSHSFSHLSARWRQSHAGMFGLARHADWYDGVAGRLAQPLYRGVVADIIGLQLPAGAVVLDIGTGPGRVPLLIAQARPDLVVEGVDLSPAMIDRATRTATAHGQGSEGVHYRVADVATLPHPDGSIDLVISTLSLHHWADAPAGLTEIRRVLRPGGMAWIYDVRWVLRRTAKADTRGFAMVVERLPQTAVHARALTALVSRVLYHLLGRVRIDR